jgi:molecular chaperone Hsp33
MQDFIVRAITSEGAFRIVACVGTDTVRDALDGVAAPTAVKEAFARAMVGLSIVRSTIHPGERFQFHVRNLGDIGELRVDSWPEGAVRGYVEPRDPEQGDRDADVFTVTRTRRLRGDEPYLSVLAVVDGNITSELERYLQHSAQIEASLSLEVATDEQGNIRWAAGVLAQPLPEATREDLRKMVGRLEELPPLHTLFAEGTEESLVRGALPEGYAFSVVAREPMRKLCVCSRERVLGMLQSLGCATLKEMIDDKEPVVVDCAYCPTKKFRVELDEVARILQSIQ